MTFITTEQTINAIEVAVDALGNRGHQLIEKGQELHTIDKQSNWKGFTDAAIWAALVGLTIVEAAAVAVAIICTLVALAGLLLGIKAGQWYYSGGNHEISVIIAEAEVACAIIGRWIGTAAFEVVQLVESAKGVINKILIADYVYYNH